MRGVDLPVSRTSRIFQLVVSDDIAGENIAKRHLFRRVTVASSGQAIVVVVVEPVVNEDVVRDRADRVCVHADPVAVASTCSIKYV